MKPLTRNIPGLALSFAAIGWIVSMDTTSAQPGTPAADTRPPIETPVVETDPVTKPTTPAQSPTTPDDGVPAPGEAVPAIHPNLFAILTGSVDFTSFVTAAKAAGLEETLREGGPFTILAPRNEAFTAMKDVTSRDLLLPANVEILRDIINYHIIPQRLMSTDFVVGPTPTTFGEPLTITAAADGTLTFQGGRLVQRDVQAENGVIHAINTVLIPPSIDITTLRRAPATDQPVTSGTPEEPEDRREP